MGGLIKSPVRPPLSERLNWITDKSLTIQYDHFGTLFLTKPNHLNWAENAHQIVAILGFVRIADDFVTAAELLNSGCITPSEVDIVRIHGNALVLCFDKHQPQFCAYKTLLSAQQLYYTEPDDSLVIANNLGTLADFVGNRKINPKAVPLHFIYRSVPGQLTYFENIFRLRPGEVLYRKGLETKIILRNTFRTLLQGEHNTKPVRPDSANEFFNEIKIVMARYLKATTDSAPHWTMLLSGGIDSSVLQMAISQQCSAYPRPLSHTFAPDIESFAPEIEYAKTASRLFGTEHTFVSVPTSEYISWLMTTIRILGQPPHHESMAYMPALFDYLRKNNANIKYLFSGQGADASHGFWLAEDIARALRYQHWPLPLMSFLGFSLKFVSASKSYGVRRMTDTLRNLRDQESHRYPLNALGAYTDWEMVYRNFGSTVVKEALAYRREQERAYLDSPHIIEKTQTVDILSDAYDTASIIHQLSLAFDKQVICPFLDDSLVSAIYKYDARDRFFMAGRTKPILKQILEMGPGASITKAPKRGGGFAADLYDWMRQGVLRDLVENMKRPSFLSFNDFQGIVTSPGWYTWNLLTFDLFEKSLKPGTEPNFT